VVLNVVTSADTVNGHSQAPGYLVGFGVIDAELVRELARDATRRLVEEPTVSPAEELRYRPGAALARWIRLRDLTCRAPGCSVPAEQCDIDHVIPFDHRDPAAGGRTVSWNLACFCREHHRCKTFGGWCVELQADGTIVWTSPAGQVSRTTPGSTALFGLTTRPRRREDHTRVERARARLCAHRATSEFNRYRNQAAAQEIRDRRWRNDTRRWRNLFHGPISDKPSTAPYMRWVNDPLEAEELQPHLATATTGAIRPRRTAAVLGVLTVLGVTPGIEHRGDGADEHHHRRGDEHDHQTAVERLGDELREERLTGQHVDVHAGLLQGMRGLEQLGDRVVAQECREQAAHRREIGDVVGHRRRDALSLQAAAHRAGQRVGQADDHQREEDADRQRRARVEERGPHTRRRTALGRRNAGHDRRGVGGGEDAAAESVEEHQ
jgi:hypothetical protein